MKLIFAALLILGLIVVSSYDEGKTTTPPVKHTDPAKLYADANASFDNLQQAEASSWDAHFADAFRAERLSGRLLAEFPAYQTPAGLSVGDWREPHIDKLKELCDAAYEFKKQEYINGRISFQELGSVISQFEDLGFHHQSEQLKADLPAIDEARAPLARRMVRIVLDSSTPFYIKPAESVFGQLTSNLSDYYICFEEPIGPMEARATLKTFDVQIIERQTVYEGQGQAIHFPSQLELKISPRNYSKQTNWDQLEPITVEISMPSEFWVSQDKYSGKQEIVNHNTSIQDYRNTIKSQMQRKLKELPHLEIEEAPRK